MSTAAATTHKTNGTVTSYSCLYAPAQPRDRRRASLLLAPASLPAHPHKRPRPQPLLVHTMAALPAPPPPPAALQLGQALRPLLSRQADRAAVAAALRAIRGHVSPAGARPHLAHRHVRLVHRQRHGHRQRRRSPRADLPAHPAHATAAPHGYVHDSFLTAHRGCWRAYQHFFLTTLAAVTP